MVGNAESIYIYIYKYVCMGVCICVCVWVCVCVCVYAGIGRGLTRAFAGEDAKFTIESRDINRNKTTSGMKPFLVSIRGVISPQVHFFLIC